MMQSVCNDVLSLLPGPTSNLFTNSDHEFIRKAVIGLPENERAVVFLRFWNENSIEEIAGILGLNMKQVQLLMHKAIMRLKSRCLYNPDFSRALKQSTSNPKPIQSRNPVEVA